MKSEESRRKEVKIRVEINEIENGPIIEKINKFKERFLDRSIKVMNPSQDRSKKRSSPNYHRKE